MTYTKKNTDKLKHRELLLSYLRVLNNLITHYKFEITQAKNAREYIEAMQKNSSNSDGQLTITNSHIGIDTTILFTHELEAKRLKDIEDIKAVLALIK